MTVLGKMRIGYVALVATLTVVVGLGAAEMFWVNSWQGSGSRSLERARAANQMTVAIGSMGTDVTALSDAVARGYGFTEAKEAFAADGATAATALESVLASTKPGSEDVATLESLEGLLDEYRQAGDRLFGLAASDPTNVATRIKPVTDSGTQLLEAATAYQESTLVVMADDLSLLGRMSTLYVILIVALGAIGIAGGIVTSLVLPRRIGRSLRAAVSGISTSASQLLAVSSQVAAGAAQTAASTNETTSTVEEVKQTAQLASEKASEVSESAQIVAQFAENAQGAVGETVAGIERMQTQMEVVAETINRLGEQTQAVGDIIGTVNDLAEQSNLLSVNASIEAAKAGEQGKGFTVVAQEVKNLAEQSKQAVAQVRAVLSEIQEASTMAVEAAREGRETVEAGKKQSVESGEAIHTLTESANKSARSAAQISASSQQQLAGMEQIKQAIESINQAGGQAATGTRQVEQEVSKLQELALALRRLVDAKATAQQRAATQESS